MKTLKWISITLIAAALLSAAVAASWVLTETALQATSGETFCATCHSMKPFAAAYADDVHGGRNTKGLTTPCADCHLPHDSQSHYLVAKLRTGAYDLWAEVLTLFREPDWVGRLGQREQFVYDSGCLKCHARLEQAPGQSQTGEFGHKTYFNAQGTMKCVTCHTQVGHKGLRERLSSPDASTGGPPTPDASQESAQ